MRCQKAKNTDLGIRRLLGQPSVQCIVSQNRLCYLHQLLHSNPSLLRAMLSASPDLPWNQLVRADLEALWKAQRFKLLWLGPPDIHPEVWADFMIDYPRQWKDIVREWTDHTQSGDTSSQARAKSTRGNSYTFSCVSCLSTFDTERALQQHARKMHAQRSVVKSWASGSGKCIVCGAEFPPGSG